jgi:hypothetical protein
MGSNWTSEAVFVGNMESYSIQLEFIGTPEGSFWLEASNDKGHPERSAAGEGVDLNTFSIIKGSEQVISEAGIHMWAVSPSSYRWVRVKWNMSAGDGEIVESQIIGKGV